MDREGELITFEMLCLLGKRRRKNTQLSARRFVLAKRPLCFIGRERSFRFRNRRLFAEELGLGGQGMVASLLGRPSNFSDTCYGLVSPCWQKQREDRGISADFP